MTTTERLISIGSRELKKRSGPNLIRGLIASVLIHSAVVSISLIEWGEKPPIVEEKPNDTTVIELIKPMPRDDQLPPVVHRPEKPVLPDIVVHPVIVDNEELADLKDQPKPEDNKPHNLTDWLFGEDGDSNRTEGNGSYSSGSTNESENIAGIVNPWDIFVPYEVKPVPLSINPQPEYPVLARKAGVEASIWVWIHVGSDGNVVEWNIIDVSVLGLGFEDAVTDVIPRWQFTPALQNKRPVAVWVAIPFKFTIKK